MIQSRHKALYCKGKTPHLAMEENIIEKKGGRFHGLVWDVACHDMMNSFFLKKTLKVWSTEKQIVRLSREYHLSKGNELMTQASYKHRQARKTPGFT